MSINQRIFDLLKHHADGQAKLAKYLGISQKIIKSWMINRSDPPAEYLNKICNFLKASLHYILTGQKDNLPDTVHNDDEIKLLEYYRRLNIENKDYIKGLMIRLFKEQALDMGKSVRYIKGVGMLS